MNDIVKNLFLWLIIAAVLMSVFSNFGQRGGAQTRYEYSKFLTMVSQGEVKGVEIDGRTIQGVTRSDQHFSTYMPMEDTGLISDLLKNDVTIEGKPPEQSSFLMQIFINWFPILLFIGVWIFFMRQMQGGGRGGAMSFGKSRARLLGEDEVKVTFADVAGADEAKQEVQELVDFLKDPTKFQHIGGRIPRGVLMVGPPGTGKTLLARAIAGEAKVPFFTISGSDFVEMFVGVGASRVRDMFEQAKKQAPCIIFIDEIDAVGRHRGAGLGGGHDEREQTLNQLLVEMDGFQEGEGVIVIAATNRPDVLDPALLRPGRFDRQVVVPLPDIKGREAILKVHLQKITGDESIKPEMIARGTPGFSGADLANLVNEAALMAARNGRTTVSMKEMDLAKDKIMMGAERRSMVMTEAEKKLTAYHEAGHTIVGRLVPEHDPVYKVTIIPRGRALGVTMHLPEQDRYSYSKRRLKSQIASLFGGRIAEELIFGKDAITTGASNDIEKATELARNMVTRWGLSDAMGPLAYGQDDGEVFLGHSVTKHKEMSQETARAIDAEIRALIDENYQVAYNVLKANVDKLHLMADALMLYETLNAEQIQDIMEGRTVREPTKYDDKPPVHKQDDTLTGTQFAQGES
ncbi:MAG: ATP-dependent zinc metalloprotease FtsH [Gammaproteobacteria bacterium]